MKDYLDKEIHKKIEFLKKHYSLTDYEAYDLALKHIRYRDDSGVDLNDLE